MVTVFAISVLKFALIVAAGLLLRSRLAAALLALILLIAFTGVRYLIVDGVFMGLALVVVICFVRNNVSKSHQEKVSSEGDSMKSHLQLIPMKSNDAAFQYACEWIYDKGIIEKCVAQEAPVLAVVMDVLAEEKYLLKLANDEESAYPTCFVQKSKEISDGISDSAWRYMVIGAIPVKPINAIIGDLVYVIVSRIPIPESKTGGTVSTGIIIYKASLTLNMKSHMLEPIA